MGLENSITRFLGVAAVPLTLPLVKLNCLSDMSEPALDAPSVLKLVIGLLSRVLQPDVIRSAFIASAADAGISGIEPFLGCLAAASEGKGKKEKGTRKPRKSSSYAMYVTRGCEKLKSDPAFAHLNVEVDGKKKAPLAMLGKLWTGLDAAGHESFNKLYQPLCEILTAEIQLSGHKTDNLHARIMTFEDNMDKACRDACQAWWQSLLRASTKVLSSAVAVESSDDDASGSDSDESDDEAAKKKAVEEKKEAEKKKVRHACTHATALAPLRSTFACTALPI